MQLRYTMYKYVLLIREARTMSQPRTQCSWKQCLQLSCTTASDDAGRLCGGFGERGAAWGLYILQEGSGVGARNTGSRAGWGGEGEGRQCLHHSL